CAFFFASRRRHTRSKRDWSSDVCSSDLDNGSMLLLKFFTQYYISAITSIGASTETNNALKIIAIVLIDPCSRLFSNDFDVPMACDADPIATPQPTFVSSRNTLNIYVTMIAPEIPAIITNTTAKESIPVSEVQISIETGWVTDLSSIKYNTSSLNPSPFLINTPETIPVNAPVNVPSNIGNKSCFNTFRF